MTTEKKLDKPRSKADVYKRPNSGDNWWTACLAAKAAGYQFAVSLQGNVFDVKTSNIKYGPYKELPDTHDTLASKVTEYILQPGRSTPNEWFAKLAEENFFTATVTAQEKIIEDAIKEGVVCEYGAKRLREFLGDLLPAKKEWKVRIVTANQAAIDVDKGKMLSFTQDASSHIHPTSNYHNYLQNLPSRTRLEMWYNE